MKNKKTKRSSKENCSNKVKCAWTLRSRTKRQSHFKLGVLQYTKMISSMFKIAAASLNKAKRANYFRKNFHMIVKMQPIISNKTRIWTKDGQ